MYQTNRTWLKGYPHINLLVWYKTSMYVVCVIHYIFFYGQWGVELYICRTRIRYDKIKYCLVIVKHTVFDAIYTFCQCDVVEMCKCLSVSTNVT